MNRSGATAWKSSVWVELPDLAVEHDEVGAMACEPRERLAERLARRDGLGVGGGGLADGARRADGLRKASGIGGVMRSDRIPPSSSMAAPSWSAGTALPCQPSSVGEERHAVALLGARDDQRGAVGGLGLGVRVVDRRRRRGRRSRCACHPNACARRAKTSACHSCIVGPR